MRNGFPVSESFRTSQAEGPDVSLGTMVKVGDLGLDLHLRVQKKFQQHVWKGGEH